MSHLTHLVLSALQPVSHTLYLNDPHRLSILSLDITASTSISQTFLAPHPAGHDGDNGAGIHAAPPTATAVAPTRVKDGLLDRAAAALNRAAARAGANVSAADRARGADALKDVAQGLGSASTASTNGALPLPAPSAGPSSSRSAPSSRPRSAGSLVVEQSTTITLKPQSFTFGRDSRLTSPFIPLGIAVRSSAHGTDIESGAVKDNSNLTGSDASLAFVSDPTPPLTALGASSSSSASHGTFNANSYDTAASSVSSGFDPTRLLPLVSPPYARARARWKAVVEASSAFPPTSLSSDASALARKRAEAGEVSVVVERNEVRLGFRLRLAASAPAIQGQGSTAHTNTGEASSEIPNTTLTLSPATDAAGPFGATSSLAASSPPLPSSTARTGIRVKASADSLKGGSPSQQALSSSPLPAAPGATSPISPPRARMFGSVSNDSYQSAQGTVAGLGEVVFLCARSPRPILEALVSGHSSAAGAPSAGTTSTASPMDASSILRSDEAAALEGVQRVVVNARTTEAQRAPRGAREELFEWTWRPRGRSAGGSPEGEKCCCAFVELDPVTGSPTLLSYFAFYIIAFSGPSSPLPTIDPQMLPSSTSPWSNELSKIAMGRPAVVRSSSSYMGRHPAGTRTSSPPIFPQRSSSRPDTPSLIAALMANDGLSFGSSSQGGEGASAAPVLVTAASKRNSIQVLGSGAKGLGATSPPSASTAAVRRRSALVDSSNTLSVDEAARRGSGLTHGNRLSPGASPRLSAPPDAFGSPAARRASRTSSLMGEAVNTEPFPTGRETAHPTTNGRPASRNGVRASLDDTRQIGTDGSQKTTAILNDLDRTELSLASISADTPILRAAIHNLERRTALVKKASKNAAKAAAEVRTALTSLSTAQNALDEALEGSASSSGGGGGIGSGGLLGTMPSTLGSLHAEYLREARQRSAQMRKEEADALFRFVEAPAQRTADLCRVALEKLKVFESESKSYYSGTQKWLASARNHANQSNGMSGTPSSEMGFHFASESGASGPDAESAAVWLKQERGEEKQRLREARFHLARLELYKTMHELHGGTEEVRLLKAFLDWSLWLEEAPSRLQRGSTDAGSNVVEQREAVLTRYRQAVAQCGAKLDAEEAAIGGEVEDLNSKIRGIEGHLVSLGADPSGLHSAEADTAHGVESSAFSADAVEPVGAARQAGNKLKSLLSGLGKGNLNLNKDLPQLGGVASSGSTQGASDTPVRALKRKISGRANPKGNMSGVNASGITSPVLDAFHKIRGGATSTTPHLQPLVFAEGAAIADNPDTPMRAGLAVTASPSLVSDFGPNSPTPDRRRNNSTSGAWKRLQLSASNAITDSLHSPKLGGVSRTSPLMGRTLSISRFPSSEPPNSADVAVGDHLQRSASMSHAAGPPIAPSLPMPSSDTRKKEGVLWVMSKPISGAAGPDAPRGVNRATHWRECWVVLSGSGHIGEYADWKNAKSLEPSNPLIDLRFATVREARGVERRFTFEVITRDSRRFFQAPDEPAMREWMAAIAKAIESLLNGTSSVRQIDKVRSSAAYGGLGLLNEAISPIGEEFGGGPAARVFGLGQGKAFSQSLTDLSSAAVNGAHKIFGRNGEPGSASGVPNKLTKRDAKGASSAHLQAMSEGDPAALAASMSPSTGNLFDQGDGIGFKTPMKKLGKVPTTQASSGHSRGLSSKTPISNKTPISGYVLLNEAMASSISIPDAVWTGPTQAATREQNGDPARRMYGDDAGSDVGDDFDRRIEQFIEDNYGSSQGEPEEYSYGPNSAQHDDAAQDRRGGQHHERSSTLPPELPAKDIRTPTSQHRAAASHSTSTSLVLPTGRRARAVELDRISRLPENRFCADCESPNPRWASWALNNQPCCIFICISCSGFHRSLGVQTSKVKSVDLDDWTDVQLEAALRWTNVLANAYWEATKPPGTLPRPNDRSFWQAKYVERRWCPAEELAAWYERVTAAAAAASHDTPSASASASIHHKASGTLTPSRSLGSAGGATPSATERGGRRGASGSGSASGGGSGGASGLPASTSILDEMEHRGPGVPGTPGDLRSASPSQASLSSDDLGIDYDDG